jgi:hypothetical protein
MRGGNLEENVNSIIQRFGLVKRDYEEIHDMVFVKEGISDITNFIEDCCLFTGHLSKDSIVVCKLEGERLFVLVSKSADKDILKALENLGKDAKIQMVDGDIEVHMSIGWDYDGVEGNIYTYGVSLNGTYKSKGIDHDISLEIGGGRRRGWDKGDGNIQIVADIYDDGAAAGHQRFIESSLMALSRLNLDRELADIVGERSQGNIPRVRHLRVLASSLYTPAGALGDVLKLSEESKEEIAKAQKKYSEEYAKMEAENERLYGSAYPMGYAQDDYDSPPDYDSDGYYGGKRRRHSIKNKVRKGGKRLTRRHSKTRRARTYKSRRA